MSVIRRFFTVGTSTLGSRILGFIRETLMASTLGIGTIADVFYIAFRFPNLFRRLLAEGTLHTSFIPMLSIESEKNSHHGAHKLSSEIFSFLFFLLLILTIFIELAMPIIVRFILAPGLDPQSDEYSLTIKLSVIMFPSLMCISLATLMSSILFSIGKYFIASISPIALNISLIFVLIYSLSTHSIAKDAVFFLSWGFLLSSIIQLFALYFYTKSYGFKLKIKYPYITDNVKKFFKIASPVVLTGGIVQINQIIGQAIASGKEGTISSLQYAERIYQLPLGVIGVSIGMAILPELSRVLNSGDDKKSFKIQNQAIELALFFAIPAVFVLCTLSKEIIQIIYERGAFSHEHTGVVSSLLSIYSIGIPAFIMLKTLHPAFYARKDTKTPMKFTLMSIIINAIISIALFQIIGGYGIACAEILSGWLNTFCLLAILLKRKQIIFHAKTIYRLISILASSVIMWICIMCLKSYLNNNIIYEQTLMNQLKNLIIILLSAGLVYLCSIVVFSGKNLLYLLKK
ncbi:murein biosynthesis integral membrane protein MurJ [Candidatus Liberibacter americanus]|uniref:Probable lipid II flippase MurJ n=1 Tax=Candidatus Liberibacter americanus str. Sao Paulo TaxID=1261131 RepID=U6B6P2_9HYPH|nr:murein biosynthesis integral membrane protein MurJ [Candidatus Liberibacter americanus]AHA27541.1 virulence factor transmembrane protein [Candidatus Liberibacter americanus str. Sao Paulo]EMS36498.1 putative peptidoglycan lipid II flippase MurJ [Candidatus Liberibacter americanus PW_SP]